VSLDYLRKIERHRNDAARTRRAASGPNEQQMAEVLTFPR
jgi:hypothetical protein